MSIFLEIAKSILLILKYYLIFCLILFIFIIGAQLSSRRHSLTNFFIINDIEPESDLAKSFGIPIDGWVMTFCSCFIPILNIKCAIFYIMLGLMPFDSNYILNIRDSVRIAKDTLYKDD